MSMLTFVVATYTAILAFVFGTLGAIVTHYFHIRRSKYEWGRQQEQIKKTQIIENLMKGVNDPDYMQKLITIQ